MSKLTSPYPYFGGKRRVGEIVWSRLGEIDNYVEPFCGSLAMLLCNPNESIPKIETVNDIDHFIVNFWRALKDDFDSLIEIVDYPLSQVDLSARHKYIHENNDEEFKFKLETDPEFYDLKIAGWWVWGMGASFSNNWSLKKGRYAFPNLSGSGGGIFSSSKDINEWFLNLHNRVKKVRITCSDWRKVVTPTILQDNISLGQSAITGLFLDPPYGFSTREKVYKNDTPEIYEEVCEWAVKNGNNKKLRIALCGYDGDFKFPSSWESYSWSTGGGISNIYNKSSKVLDRDGQSNSKKERIYFSPHCLR